MRYAVLSDIHGNAPGLELVLKDAKAWGAEGYLLLGDYTGEFPWPNEVVELIRALPNATLVAGNREEYAHEMVKEDVATWQYQHRKTLYWVMNTLTKENLDYLLSLPLKKQIEIEGMFLFLAHKLEDFFPAEGQTFIKPSRLLAMEKGLITNDQMTAYFIQSMREKPQAYQRLEGLPKGIYFFGHNHMPWIKNFGDKLLVNPGAVSMKLDRDYRLTYIRLEIIKGRIIHEEMVYIPYSLPNMAKKIRASDLYQAAGDWAEITIKNLYTAEDEVHQIFKAIKALAKEKGIPYTFPVENSLWQEVYVQWAVAQGILG